MKENKICYAVLGLGIGMAHAEAAFASENCILYAACDIDKERLERFSSLYPDAKTFTDFDEMLTDECIDIISICLPSSMHSDFAVRAMEAGKNVLVEKPLDITPERAMLIEDARLRTGKTCGVVHQNRFNAVLFPLRNALKAGLFGDIYLGTFAVKWYRDQKYYDRGGWRGTWDIDGGGSLMNQSIHTVDIMLWLMGDIKSVHSIGKICAHNIKTEDLTASLIEFESGATATFVSTTAAYPGISTDIMIYGTKGSFEADGDKLRRFSLNFDALGDDVLNKGLPSLFDGLGIPMPAESVDFDEDELSEFLLEKLGKGNRNASKFFPDAFFGHRHVIEDMILSVKTGKDPEVMPLEAIKSVKAVNRIYAAAGIGAGETL